MAPSKKLDNMTFIYTWQHWALGKCGKVRLWRSHQPQNRPAHALSLHVQTARLNCHDRQVSW
jgi:hypothetical protein